MKYGVALLHYNRLDNLKKILPAVLNTVPEDTRVVICDDGSKCSLRQFKVPVITGKNLGVAANKNRGLFTLQDCKYIVLLEDDLIPIKKGWLETYEKAFRLSGIHHFCRVQNKEVSETSPEFSRWMKNNGLTPIYGPTPRGDLTFITNRVLQEVGGLNPKFVGAGYAHGSWAERIHKAGLIGHPNRWIDIMEARDCFEQINDKKGGRWNEPEKVKKQIEKNKKVLKEVKNQMFVPLQLL